MLRDKETDGGSSTLTAPETDSRGRRCWAGGPGALGGGLGHRQVGYPWTGSSFFTPRGATKRSIRNGKSQLAMGSGPWAVDHMQWAVGEGGAWAALREHLPWHHWRAR